MGCGVGLWRGLLAVGLVAACLLPASASAYTYVVRPNSTITAGSWTVAPGGTIDSVLDDNVLSPTAPSTSGDHISENGNGPVGFEVGLTSAALRSGENVVSVTGWMFGDTGDARTLDADLRTGATVLASGSWAAGLPSGWRSLGYSGSLTQAQLDDLRQAATLQGSGASSVTRLYAAYAEVTTDMNAAPTITPPTSPSPVANPSWSFSATAAASYQCRLDKGGTQVSDWVSCTSGYSFDLDPSGDGTYTFGARALDEIGAPQATATATYTLDRAPPDPPTIDSGPPDASNNTLAMWSFTAEAGAFAYCRLSKDGTEVSGWTLCTTPTSYDLSGPGKDGAYTFEVRATDLAGNEGSPSSDSFTLDTTPAAAPTITAEPSPAGSSANPSWSFAYEAGATPKCRLERDGTQVSDWTACASPYAPTLGADGIYTVQFRADDAAGNTGNVTTRTYTLDRVNPAPPAITGGPADPSNTQTAQYTFTGEVGATYECRLERGGTAVSDWASCTSPRSYDMTGQPDGVYTFLVHARDAAGNQSTDASRTYTRDRTAPVAPTITGGPPPSSADPAPSYSFTHEIGATATCRMMRGATVVVNWTACSSPHAYDLSAQVDETYTFYVRATDAAANTGAEATRSFTLDRIAPDAPTITGRPSTVTNDDTPTWTFTASFDVTKYRCRIERGATVISDYTVCTSPHTYNLGAQPDGTYTFKVRGSDDSANESTETNDTFTLDRVAPPAPTITGGPTGSSQNAAPSYSFTAEAGASTQCRVDRDGGTVVSDWAPCVSPRSYDLTLGPDGVYTFRVRATDTATNTGAEAIRTYTLDRTPPAAPAITGGPAADSNDDTPVYSFTAEPGATFQCRLERGGTDVSGWGPCSTPVGYDLSAPTHPDGTYTFHVRAYDAAGNESLESTRAYALDRVKPPAPTLTQDPGADTNDETPTWAFTAEAGTTTTCRLEKGAIVVSAWSPCASPRTYDLTGQQGTYTFRVVATDAAGNDSVETAFTTTLDTDDPAAPTITGGPTGDSQDDTPTYTWTAEAGARVECRIERDGVVVSGFATCTSPHTYNLATDGLHTFTVRAIDAAGNQGPDATRTYTLDRAEPAAPVIVNGPNADSTDDSPTYTFTAEAGATLRCELRKDGVVISAFSLCASPRTYDVSTDGDGFYRFSVFATDAAGNESPAATRDYTLDTTTPLSPVLDARPGDQGKSRTPEWAFSTTEPNKTFECRLARGATVLFGWAPCVSPRPFDLNLEPDGTYDFGVRAVNAAGTRSLPTTDAYRLDTNPPAAPVISDGPAPDSTDDTPTWTITAEPGATLECLLERDGTVVDGWTPCSSPQSYTLATDGTYTFRTRATDAATNEGAVASTSYNLDRSTPTAPVLGVNPPAAGTDDTPTWEFTGEPGRTFECKLTRDGALVSDWTACTSPHTPTLASDGNHTLEVRAVTAAGTRGPITSDDYELDRGTPAAPAITDGPPASSSDATPTFTFTGEPGARFECEIRRADGTAVVAFATCTSPDTSNLVSEPDGDYTFVVHQLDRAGNTSADASRSYTLDRSIPSAPVVDTRPASPGRDETPEWTMTGTTGLTLECRLTRGATVVSDWTNCTSPRGYDLVPEPDGTYRFHVRQYNSAGTRGPAATDDYVLDATLPAAPEITGAPAPVASGSEPTWSFNAEVGAVVECRLQRGGLDVRPWGPCTSPRTYGLAGEPDGDYAFSVRATDAAGNVSPVTTNDHRVDRVAPAPPAIGDNPGPLGRVRTPSWSFTAEDGATFECTLAGTAGTVDEWAICASPRGYDLGAREDGSYAFGVRARDAAGNTSPATSASYVLDTTPGGVTIQGGPAPRGRDRAPAWRFAGEEGSSFECRLALRDGPVADWSPCTSPKGFDLSGKPDGTFAFSLRAVDAAGNVGPAGTAAYELDTTPPAAPSIERRPDSPSDDRTPTWRFSGEENATFTCRVERQPSGTVLDWTLCASPFTADLAREANGSYRFSVRATDLAGNVGEPASGEYELAPGAPPRNGGGDTTDDPDEDAAPPLTPAPPKTKPREREEPAPAAKPKPKKAEQDAGASAPRPERGTGAKPAESAPQPAPKKERGGNFATRAVADAVDAITKHPDKSVFPLSLLLLVLAFLAIQNRIDRSDPKLALAPTFADPDLEFRPPPGDDL